MKPQNPNSATQVVAESIRSQLGTEAVILITPGSPKYAVVVAQAADTPVCSAEIMAESDRRLADPQQIERLAYSVEEAATALGLSRDVIYDQLRTGRLRSLKVGRRRTISRQHIDDFLADG